MDSLLSIVQMPKGIAVGTYYIGTAGAFNAWIIGLPSLANNDAELAARVDAFREKQTRAVLDNPDPREV